MEFRSRLRKKISTVFFARFTMATQLPNNRIQWTWCFCTFMSLNLSLSFTCEYTCPGMIVKLAISCKSSINLNELWKRGWITRWWKKIINKRADALWVMCGGYAAIPDLDFAHTLSNATQKSEKMAALNRKKSKSMHQCVRNCEVDFGIADNTSKRTNVNKFHARYVKKEQPCKHSSKLHQIIFVFY